MGAPICGDPLYNEKCLKDTKVHSEWYFIEYTAEYSARILGEMDIGDSLRAIDVTTLDKVELLSDQTPEDVVGVFSCAKSALEHREDNCYPDFGISKGSEPRRVSVGVKCMCGQ